MIAILASALLVLAASIAAGRSLLVLLGRPGPTLLSAPVGFAALLVLAPALIRLPGRALTAAILIALLIVVATLLARRARPPVEAAPGRPARGSALVALAAVALTIAFACLPFAIHGEAGILGEGVYTNDQAAQLYWADWLQSGFGPEPRAVGFGYPTGPHAVAAVAAEVTGASLDRAFNGLMIAIPALGVLAALAALGGLAPTPRLAAAVACGLPYLGASWLAQSGFKESAMGVLVLAAAVALLDSGRRAGRATTLAILALLAAAGAFTLSPLALAWFAAIGLAWIVLEALRGRPVASRSELRELVRRHRSGLAVGTLLVLAVGAVAAVQLGGFADRVSAVGTTFGRLDSPVFWGTALGVWPEGDFRLVRGEVAGAVPATLLGLGVLAAGLVISWRRGETALVAVIGACAGAYLATRALAGLHVQAKALAIMAPAVIFVAARGLLERGSSPWRLAAGSVFVALALGSSFLALREAPVGFRDRAAELAELREIAAGEPVVFLALDRFAAYEMRGTLLESPGGYVPRRVRARPEKVWQQGMPLDFDTVPPDRLDRFRYAVTTSAGFQSSPPATWRAEASTESFVLWHRDQPTPDRRVLADEGGDPGAVLDCDSGEGRRVASPGVTALSLATPVVARQDEWGIEQPLEAPAEAELELEMPPGPGPWRLSLQYHSQVPLTVEAGGEAFELPPSLTGMYHTSPGRGSFWDAGELDSVVGPVTVRVTAGRPNLLARTLGAPARVWLGDLAATRAGFGPSELDARDACGSYIDGWLPGDGRGR